MCCITRRVSVFEAQANPRVRARSAMKSIDSKRPRLTGFARGSYVSQRALAALLTKARDEGIPDQVSKTSQIRARKRESHIATPHGDLLQEWTLPGNIKITVQHPLAMLWEASKCDGFASLMRETFAKNEPSPSTPWHLIVYNDEIGLAPLKHDTRKTMAIYYSFKEFDTALFTEEVWFVLTAIRSDLLTSVPGGIGYVMKELMKKYFFNPACNLAEAGAMLHLAGDNAPMHMLFADLKIFVADEKALKDAFSIKGSSGTKLCSLCMNIVNHRSALAGTNASCRPSTCTNVAALVPHTDDTLLRIAHDVKNMSERVKRCEVSLLAFDEAQQMDGVTHNEPKERQRASRKDSELVDVRLDARLRSQRNLECRSAVPFRVPRGERLQD